MAAIKDVDNDVVVTDSNDAEVMRLKAGTRFNGIDLYDATNVTISATTGSKIGQSTSKIGFFGITAAARPSAYTQTYSTATRTHSNLTSVAVATTAASTAAAAAGYATKTIANAIVTAINALRTDVTNLKGVVNSLIDDGQTLGLLQ